MSGGVTHFLKSHLLSFHSRLVAESYEFLLSDDHLRARYVTARVHYQGSSY